MTQNAVPATSPATLKTRRASPFWGLQEAWRPNGHPTVSVQRGLVLVTALLFFGVWVLNSGGIFPGPGEVFDAYPSLLQQGLLYQLYVSLVTNVQAILLSCLLTVPLAYLTVGRRNRGAVAGAPRRARTV